MTSKWINCLIVTFQDGGIIIPSSRDVFLSAKEDCTKCTYIHSLRFLTCSSNNSQQGRWRLGWTRTNTPCKTSETINVLRSTLSIAPCTCIFLSTCLYTEQDLFIQKRLWRSRRSDKVFRASIVIKNALSNDILIERWYQSKTLFLWSIQVNEYL